MRDLDKNSAMRYQKNSQSQWEIRLSVIYPETCSVNIYKLLYTRFVIRLYVPVNDHPQLPPSGYLV